MQKFIFSLVTFLLTIPGFSQNVGISRPNPTEKLHVDSGNIKIGNGLWSPTSKSLLKFGDADYLSIGEEEADDKMTIRAKELFIRPSGIATAIPLTIQGTNNFSHFYFGLNEDTYIRGGKTTSNVVIGDGGGRTGVGVYPNRAGFEQNGAVGTTAALFGGEGAGISLQRNWPAVGFNEWYDGSTHRSIAQGYSAQLGVNQNNGSLYLASWPYAAVTNANLGAFTQRFFVSRFGKIGLGTDDPYADVEIVHRDMNFNDEDVDAGITYRTTLGTKWNTHIGLGVIGNFTTQYSYSFWTNTGSGWNAMGAVNNDGSYWQASDKDLKKNIDYLQSQNCLEKIKQLKPASYLFKKEADGHPLSYGFIAQDLEKIFPEMVMQMKTNKLISYSSLIPILTAGIQEQQQQIEKIERENTALKEILNKLIATTTQLQQQVQAMAAHNK